MPVTAESRSAAEAGFGALQANLLNRAPEAFDVFGRCLVEDQILEPRGPQDARRAAADALNLADPVERLFAAELEAIGDLLGELSRRSGLDAVAAWVQTSTSKRVMYVTFPTILRDPIDATFFPRRQINSRVQLFETEPIERSVRLEAISTFAGTDSRFRYALSIQYLPDETGVWWQVLRPIILVQPSVIDTIAALGDDARRTLLESLRLLALMVSQGSHDYLHGMMMRWFLPPKIDCPPEYRRLMVEQPAPPEMQGWESRATGRVSGPVSRGDAIPISDPLEYWSLAMHAESVERIAEREPWRLEALHELQDLYAARLEAIAGLRPSAEVKAAAELLLAVSSFFLILIDPRREETATEERSEDGLLDRSTVQRFVAGFHRGLADVVVALDRRQFVWDGVRSSIYDVFGIYMRDMQRLYDRLTATGGPLRYDVYEELARGRRLA